MNDSEYNEIASACELKRSKAMVDGDISQLNEIFSEDLYYGHSGGFWDNRHQFIEKIEAGYYHYNSVNTTIEKTIPLGEDGLVVHGKVNISVRINGIEQDLKCIYLAIWKVEHGQWRFLAHQTGRLPDES